MASPMRIPVTASSPINVRYVAWRRAVRKQVVIASRAAMSPSE
jgi:hypothetical protein